MIRAGRTGSRSTRRTKRSCSRRLSRLGASWWGCWDSSWCVNAPSPFVWRVANVSATRFKEGTISLAATVQRESEKLVKETSTLVEDLEELHECAFRSLLGRLEGS